MRLFVVLASLSLLPACVLPGSSPWNGLHAEASAAYFPVSGDISAGSVVATNGGSPDFEGGLRTDADESSSYLIGAKFGLAPIEVGVRTFGFDGTMSGQVIDGDFFNGNPTGGMDFDVTTDLELDAHQLLLGFDMVNLPPGRVALILGVDYLDVDTFSVATAEVVGGMPIGTRIELANDESVPLPVVGLRGDVWMPFNLRAGATIVGGTLSYDDVDYDMIDLDVALHWEPGFQVEVVLGYRLLDLELDGDFGDTSFDGSIGFDGPYLGVDWYF